MLDDGIAYRGDSSHCVCITRLLGSMTNLELPKSVAAHERRVM